MPHPPRLESDWVFNAFSGCPNQFRLAPARLHSPFLSNLQHDNCPPPQCCTGDTGRTLLRLKEMSRSSTLAATSDEGYSLAELCTDIAKDLKVIFAMGKMDPKYKRVARSLMSIIAHPRARMSVRAVAKVLGVTVYQAWMARKHAESHFAGACVEHVIHKRCAIPEDVAIHLSAYSVSGEMCKVRMASMRNAISKALLERNMPITQLYKKYRFS